MNARVWTHTRPLVDPRTMRIVPSLAVLALTACAEPSSQPASRAHEKAPPTTRPAPSSPGPAALGHVVVRTAEAHASTHLDVRCLPEERLLGGGCSCPKIQTSRPSGQQADDTLGAGWECACGAYWGGEPTAAY